MAYGMAGVNEPRKEIQVAEPYDPFDYKELTTSKGCCSSTAGRRPRPPPTGVTARDGTSRAVRPAGCSASGTRSPPPG